MPLPNVDDVASLGGALNNAWELTDPTTDLDATSDNKARNNNAAMTHTLPRAIYRFYAATTPTEPASNVHDAVWGDDVSYKPTATYESSTGIYKVTWPETVDNLLAQEGATTAQGAETDIPVAFRYVVASSYGATFFKVDATVNTSANIIDLKIWDAAGALVNPTSTNCLITLVCY